MQPQSVVASGVNDVKAPEQHAKHVAVPDVSDNVDPWAAPMPVPQQAPVDDDPWGNPCRFRQDRWIPCLLQRNLRWFRSTPITSIAHRGRTRHRSKASRMRSVEPAVLRAGAANAAVAAEDDEYSMSDESIGASTALSVDDLTRLFEVKKSRISGRTMQKTRATCSRRRISTTDGGAVASKNAKPSKIDESTQS